MDSGSEWILLDTSLEGSRLGMFARILYTKTQPSSWPSRFRLIILGGNRQGLQVDRDKAVLFGDWGEARSEKA
jgi:hypothetical protein